MILTEKQPLPSAEIFELCREILSQGRRVKIKLTGNSMSPFLRPYDVGIVQACTAQACCVGDVLVFRHKQSVVAHRLIKKTVQSSGAIQLTTKGDACRKPDTPFDSGLLLGKLAAFERGGRQKNLSAPGRKLIARFFARFPACSFFISVFWQRTKRLANFS